MKALVYNDGKINLIEKQKPIILDDKDAIVKVKLSSICTSDLHIIKGFVPSASNNIVLGHEFVGEVVEVGSNVKNIEKYDRVSANCETFCNECYFCQRGYVNNCLNGGWQIGHKIDGCQAQYIRVPYADNCLTKIPTNVSYKNALFVGDILASGYFGCELCEIKESDVVAIIGSGPVGLCSMIISKIMKAHKIVVIDINDERLKIAKNHNLADYYFNPIKCDIKKEIKEITSSRGVDCTIEVAGGQNTFDMSQEITRPNGIIALVAMYEQNQIFKLPSMYGKNLIFKTGGVDGIHSKKLLKYISEGKINTDFLITHEYCFDDILEAYEFFENNKDKCLKVMIKY